MLTHSRGGFLALLAGLAAFVHLRFGGKKTVLLGLLCLPLLFVVFAGRMTSLSADEGTGQTRIQLWSDGLTIFQHSPLVGIGMENYRMFSSHVAHNSFIHCYAELGLLGGSLFVGAFYFAVKGMYDLRPEAGDTDRDIRPELRRLYPFLMGTLVAYTIGICFLSRGYIVPTYMVLGLAVVFMRLHSKQAAVPMLKWNGFFVWCRLGGVSVSASCSRRTPLSACSSGGERSLVMPLKLLLVAGARPNFMKVAPLLWEIHTVMMSMRFWFTRASTTTRRCRSDFFAELEIPRPDENLEVGSGSHAVQTAEVMKRFEPVLLRERPDAVVVVGDVNSTLALALTATSSAFRSRMSKPVCSLDRSMPEEINRILTDAISDLVVRHRTERHREFAAENVPSERIHFVGNVMIDTLMPAKRDRRVADPGNARRSARRICGADDAPPRQRRSARSLRRLDAGDRAVAARDAVCLPGASAQRGRRLTNISVSRCRT